MASAASTFWLGTIVAAGFVWIGFFEPRIPTTVEVAEATRRVVDAPASDVERLRLHRDRWTEADIERADGGAFRSTAPADRVLEPRPVLELLSRLEFAEVRSRVVGSEADAAHLETYGLTQPALVVSLQLRDGSERELAFGKPDVSGTGVYVRVGGRDDVAIADKALLDDAETLLDRLTAPDTSGGDVAAPARETPPTPGGPT